MTQKTVLILGANSDIAKALADVYAKNNYSIIRLDAFAENKPVLRFYERAGYQKIGTVWFPYKPEGYEWYDCYEKEIKEGIV